MQVVGAVAARIVRSPLGEPRRRRWKFESGEGGKGLGIELVRFLGSQL